MQKSGADQEEKTPHPIDHGVGSLRAMWPKCTEAPICSPLSNNALFRTQVTLSAGNHASTCNNVVEYIRRLFRIGISLVEYGSPNHIVPDAVGNLPFVDAHGDR